MRDGATNYLPRIFVKLHDQNLLLFNNYPTPFPHMADEDLSDEQVRQLLKDAEERLRSKRAGSKTSLNLQNRYSRPISYMNPPRFADRLTDTISHPVFPDLHLKRQSSHTSGLPIRAPPSIPLTSHPPRNGNSQMEYEW